MYIMYMLTSARETGSCQVSSFLHDADNISGCFECDSSSNMCFECSKELSHRNGETVLLSTQDKCLLLRNQVICHLRILIWRSGYFFSCTFSKKILQWRQRTVEAHCLKFWNLFCKPIPMRRRICISMLCLLIGTRYRIFLIVRFYFYTDKQFDWPQYCYSKFLKLFQLGLAVQISDEAYACL